MALTPKQEKFVQGLFTGLSQRSAYKEAFDTSNMKDETIDSKACNLLKEDKIRARLTELQDEVKQKNIWTLERLLEKFEEIGTKSLEEEEIIDMRGQRTGVFKFDSGGANKAFENIGKLLGFYKDKLEHSGEIGAKIVYDIPRRNSKPT